MRSPAGPNSPIGNYVGFVGHDISGRSHTKCANPKCGRRMYVHSQKYGYVKCKTCREADRYAARRAAELPVGTEVGLALAKAFYL